MKKYFEKYPFYVFLLFPYLTIFIYAQNVHLLHYTVLLRPMLISFFVSSIIFIISYYILNKHIQKSGLYSGFIIFLLANYGFFYDYLEKLYYNGLWPFKNIHRYELLAYILLFISSFLFIKKTKYHFINLTRWLNILVSSLFVLNTVYIIINPNANQFKKENCLPKFSLKINKAKPDIYYFVFDGYANFKILKKYYTYYDDTALYNYLKNKGFYIAENSFSNYYFTSTSLSSILNLNYLNKEQYSISNNLVFKIFKALGYRIIVINSGDSRTNNFICTDQLLNNDIITDFERAILRNTILRIDDLFGIIPYFRIKNQLETLKNLNYNDSIHEFIFSHVLCPHPQYVFSKEGNIKPINSFADNIWEPKEAYLEQLTFISKQIISIVDNILKKYQSSNIKPIIIIQSDHGPFYANKNPEIVKQCRVYNLNAMLLQENRNLYPNISSVNTFRYILKYEFGLNINLLNDSMAGINELITNQNFIDATK